MERITMKFKLIEKFDETRSVVQDYMYDAMDELNNALFIFVLKCCIYYYMHKFDKEYTTI